MGKVPGIRNRQKKAKSLPAQTSLVSPPLTDISTRESSKEPGMDPSYLPTCNDSFFEWIQRGDQIESYDLPAFNDENILLGFADSDSTAAYMSNTASPSFYHGSPNLNNASPEFLTESSSDFDFQIPTLNFPIDGLQTPPINDYDNIPSHQPFIKNEPSIPASPAKSLASLHRKQLNYLNPQSPKPQGASLPPTRASSPSAADLTRPPKSARCISACTEIIEYLDTQIRSDLTALDAVMRVNKMAATELSQILSLPDCRASASSPLLTCIAMDQIVTLFECSILSGDSLPVSSNQNVGPTSLGFFQVDPEEMVALRAHFISKELRRSLQVLDTLNHQLQNPALQTVPSVALHKQWTSEMAHRLNNLLITVGDWKTKCIGSIGKEDEDYLMLT